MERGGMIGKAEEERPRKKEKERQGKKIGRQGGKLGIEW